MEIIAPSPALFFWTLLSLVSLTLISIAVFHLLRNRFITGTSRTFWLLIILFVPLFGATFYLTIGRKQQADT